MHTIYIIREHNAYVMCIYMSVCVCMYVYVYVCVCMYIYIKWFLQVNCVECSTNNGSFNRE